MKSATDVARPSSNQIIHLYSLAKFDETFGSGGNYFSHLTWTVIPPGLHLVDLPMEK